MLAWLAGSEARTRGCSWFGPRVAPCTANPYSPLIYYQTDCANIRHTTWTQQLNKIEVSEPICMKCEHSLPLCDNEGCFAIYKLVKGCDCHGGLAKFSTPSSICTEHFLSILRKCMLQFNSATKNVYLKFLIPIFFV